MLVGREVSRTVQRELCLWTRAADTATTDPPGLEPAALVLALALASVHAVALISATATMTARGVDMPWLTMIAPQPQASSGIQ